MCMRTSFLRSSTLPAILGILLLASGCGSSLFSGRVSEGVIEYGVTFPDMDPDGLRAGMLPDKSTLSFVREHQSMDLSAGMGVFRTSMVINTPSKLVDYHMSVMGKNLVAELHPSHLLSFNKTPPTMAVLFPPGTDTIAGYVCKKAVLVYEDIDRPETEVWYTDAIDMDNPNWFSPFSEIPGVLMRYEVVQHNIRMRLEAVSIKSGAVDAATFAVRPDHEGVTPDALYQQLDEVLGTYGN